MEPIGVLIIFAFIFLCFFQVHYSIQRLFCFMPRTQTWLNKVTDIQTLCSFFPSLSPSSLPSRVSEALQQVFSGRAQIRREQLDLERQLKENELRQQYCEKDNLYVQHFCAKEKTEKVLMPAPLAKDPNIPAENQQLSHRFLFLFPIVVFESHLQHYRTESPLHSIWLFSAALLQISSKVEKSR